MECSASVGAMVGMEGGSHGPESTVKKEWSGRGGGGGSLKKGCLMFGPSVWLVENAG